MNKLIAIVLLLSFALPLSARGGVIKDLDPVEPELLGVPKPGDELKRDRVQPMEENQRLTDEFQINMKKSEQPKSADKKSGSSWWKWTLGLLIVGGVAAAAGGGGGGDGGSTSSTVDGTVSTTW